VNYNYKKGHKYSMTKGEEIKRQAFQLHFQFERFVRINKIECPHFGDGWSDHHKDCLECNVLVNEECKRIDSEIKKICRTIQEGYTNGCSEMYQRKFAPLCLSICQPLKHIKKKGFLRKPYLNKNKEAITMFEFKVSVNNNKTTELQAVNEFLTAKRVRRNFFFNKSTKGVER